MSKSKFHTNFFFVLCILLASCDSPEYQRFSSKEITKIEKMQNPFLQPVHRLFKPGDPRGVPYTVDNCKIYIGQQTPSGVIIDWSVVADLETELTRLCDDSYISESGEYLIIGIVTKNYYAGVGFIYREFRIKHDSPWERRYKSRVCPPDKSSTSCYFIESEWSPTSLHERD